MLSSEAAARLSKEENDRAVKSRKLFLVRLVPSRSSDRMHLSVTTLAKCSCCHLSAV